MMTDMVLFYIKTSENKVVFIFKINVTNNINSEILNKILLGKKMILFVVIFMITMSN